MKQSFFFIMHMPPPVHGASMMGKYIHDSQIINENFDCSYFNLTLAKSLQDIGKGGFHKLWDFCKQLYEIRKAVIRNNPELCYVTPNAKGAAFYKDFFVVMMLKAMGKKVVIHYHNKGVATKQDNWVDNFLYKHFFKKLKVVLLAEPLYNDICKYVNRNDVYICPNGIPSQRQVLPKIEHKGFNILFLSNMMGEKGVWDLLEACKILKDKKKNFHCHFVGKWSDVTESDFNDRVINLNLKDEVTAYGAKYGKEKNEFLQKADVFVFPTYYNNECFPLVLLEAMEQGLPCISTNEGGISAIIDEAKTGYVIDKHNPQMLAERIEYLIQDPDICRAMGIAGREKFIREFTLERFEYKIKEILQDILSESKK